MQCQPFLPLIWYIEEKMENQYIEIKIVNEQGIMEPKTPCLLQNW